MGGEGRGLEEGRGKGERKGERGGLYTLRKKGSKRVLRLSP
jgi:hypothetical protein